MSPPAFGNPFASSRDNDSDFSSRPSSRESSDSDSIGAMGSSDDDIVRDLAGLQPPQPHTAARISNPPSVPQRASTLNPFALGASEPSLARTDRQNSDDMDPLSIVARMTRQGSVQVDPFTRTTRQGSVQVDPFTRTTRQGSVQVDPFTRTTRQGSDQVDPFTRTTRQGSDQIDPFTRTTRQGSDQVDPFTTARDSSDADSIQPLPAFASTRPRPKKSVSFQNAESLFDGPRRASAFALQGVEDVVAQPSRVRQKSSIAEAGQIPRRGSVPRRMSQFNPFDDAFARVRRTSEIGPTDTSRPISRRQSWVRKASSAWSSYSGSSDPSRKSSSVAPDEDSVAAPPRAYLRSKSTGAAGFFRNPFSDEREDQPTDFKRRQSTPLERRPSNFQRMMSMVGEENPIPFRYRSKSVSSLQFYLSSLESSNTTLPIFEDDIEAQKENIQEYLAGVERLQAAKTRTIWESRGFQGTYFFIIVAFVYFVFIGQPLWPGAAILYYRWLRTAGIGSLGCLIFMGWAGLQAFLPLISQFEKEVDSVESRDASETALVIPAYKAAAVLGETIQAALVIFKPEQIFIINNGSTPEPTDNTAEVCAQYGVNHAWVPVGSKIVAEFVGVALTRKYKYIMLIDDDVHLPPNLPIVTDRLQGMTKCIGYTIKSTGANGIRGTQIQQCQDMEYKSSGLTRQFCGEWGSATFPHGAIILWEREILQDLFNVHPGYVISEDWYFGHAARSCGYRIEFCSQVFVETETPPNFFQNGKSERGGFGEMTVYKQRFGRWNYFYVFRVWEDTIYILFSWRLGFFREIITKIFVMVEVYDSVMAFLRPFVIVITAIAAWKLLVYMTIATLGMYLLNFAIFNGVHLRRKGEMVQWRIIPMYMWMKFVLLWVNSQSVYWGIWDYARFFKVRHSRVIENRQALEAAYNVRLGTRMIPLDTQLGDGLAQQADETEQEKLMVEPVLGVAGKEMEETFSEKTTIV